VRERGLASAIVTVTPHDALFKSVFSDPARAAELLRHVLGPEVARHIDFASLRPEDRSFIDDDLRATHVDLLFTALYAGVPIKIYLLLEHQSSADPWMPLRLLIYMVRIWEEIRRDDPRPRRLPLILPVVVHHSDEGWTGDTRFESLFDLPAEAEALLPFVPRFRFALDDLGAAGAAALHLRAVTAYTRLVLSALLAGRGERHIGPLLHSWSDLLQEMLGERLPEGALVRIFRYLFETRGATEFEAFRTALREIRTIDEVTMETIAQMLERRGREAGRQEGRQEGLRELLLRGIGRRFGGPSASVVERVERAEPALLEQWFDRVFDARSVDELFAV